MFATIDIQPLLLAALFVKMPYISPGGKFILLYFIFI